MTGRHPTMRPARLLALLAATGSPALAQQAAAPVVINQTVAPPESARLRGEHGELVLEGKLSPEGTISGLAVVESTGSAELDALALRRYEGTAVAESRRPTTEARVRIEIKVINFNLPAGKPIEYPCDQAVRDYDWWAATFPGRPVEDEFLFGALRGMGMVLQAPGLEFVRGRDGTAALEKAWHAAIAECRNRPDDQFIRLLMDFGKTA